MDFENKAFFRPKNKHQKKKKNKKKNIFAPLCFKNFTKKNYQKKNFVFQHEATFVNYFNIIVTQKKKKKINILLHNNS